MFKQLLKIAVATAALLTAAPSAQAQVKLRGVSMFPQSFVQTQSFLKFIERVNQATQGKVVLEFAGGPEVIPIPKQGEALRNGIVDFAYTAPTNSIGIFPEAEVFANSYLSPMERRERGGMELFDKILAKRLNAKLLQFIDGGSSLHLFLRDEPPRKADGSLELAGLKLRSSELYIRFMRAMGATPVVLQSPEIYTALERRTVDGFAFSIQGVREAGWHKLVKFWVEPPIYWTSTFVAMNLNKWNALPKDLQDTIMRVSVEFEKESYEAFLAFQDKEREEFVKAGMRKIELNGAAADTFTGIAHQALWTKVADDQKLEFDRPNVLRNWHGRPE
jgi:TRAP-type C4-dicarboxylate transport system substrate-binding protein